MNREVKNYIIVIMGFGVILLIAIFHLFSTINSLLWSYNNLVDFVNQAYNQTFSKRHIVFFGEGLTSITLLVDILLVMIVSIILAMNLINLYWNVKESKERFE